MQKIVVQRTKPKDATIIIGWTVRYQLGSATYQAPLAIDGRDYYEYELEATNAYWNFFNAGIPVEIEPVWGQVITYTIPDRPERPKCRFHKTSVAFWEMTYTVERDCVSCNGAGFDADEQDCRDCKGVGEVDDSIVALVCGVCRPALEMAGWKNAERLA